MKTIFLPLLAALALTGCAFNQTVKYKYIGEPVPAALIQDCTVTAPPARAQYNSSTWDQKEALLSNSLQGTYKDLAQCNGDKKALRDWQAKQNQLKANQDGKLVK